MKVYALTLVVFILSACAGTEARTDFCDTWSTNDGSGESVLWTPNEKQEEIILKRLGLEKTYVCAERNPSGVVSVVSFGKGKGHYSHKYLEKEGELIFVDEEIFVSTH